MRTVDLHPFSLEIELPDYTQANLVWRDAITGFMLLHADRVARRCHLVDRLGHGSNQIHILHFRDRSARLALLLYNQYLLHHRVLRDECC